MAGATRSVFIGDIIVNPQKENGYTPIANEIMEALIRSGLNGTENAVVLHLLRQTYGWRKLEDEISISQFCKAIPVTRRAISHALQSLKLVKIITLVKKGSCKKYSNLWRFNKNYTEWQLGKKRTLVNKHSRTSENSFPQLVNKTTHTKETIQKKAKENISLQIKDLLLPIESHLKARIEAYFSKAAANNKTKRITEGRKLTLLLELLNSKETCADDKLFTEAIEGAIKYNACNIGYVNAIIKRKKLQC